MIDPLGRVVTELRSDVPLIAWSDRIRAANPDVDDAKGAGSYQRFVVVVRLGVQRSRRLPTVDATLVARCYGAGGNPAQDASVGAGLVSDALHRKGPRVSPGGIGIYGSFDVGGEGAAADPVTDQPYESVVIQVVAADRPIE